MKTKYKRFAWRIVLYLIGQFLCAVSVALSINSNLGVSAGNAIPYIFNNLTHIDMGICTFGFFLCLVLAQIIMLKKEFKAVNLIQLLGTVVFSAFVSLTTKLFSFWIPVTYGGRLLQLCVSIVVMALGIAIYIDTKIITNTPEATVLAISKCLKIDIGYCKIIQDCTLVFLAVVFSLLAFGRVLGVREGTAIAALAVGKIMGVFHKRIVGFTRRVCYGEEQPASERPVAD